MIRLVSPVVAAVNISLRGRIKMVTILSMRGHAISMMRITATHHRANAGVSQADAAALTAFLRRIQSNGCM